MLRNFFLFSIVYALMFSFTSSAICQEEDTIPRALIEAQILLYKGAQKQDPALEKKIFNLQQEISSLKSQISDLKEKVKKEKDEQGGSPGSEASNRLSELESELKRKEAEEEWWEWLWLNVLARLADLASATSGSATGAADEAEGIKNLIENAPDYTPAELHKRGAGGIVDYYTPK